MLTHSFRVKKTSWYINHPLCHSRPIGCSSGASYCLSFLQPCFLFSFLCLPISLLFTHMFYFYFSSISSISSFVLLVLPCFLSVASWWSLPCDLFALLAPCALWLPLADVAHHRAQHALNKPSNPKTPQGTILSAPNLPPTSMPALWMPTAAICRQDLPNLSLPSCCY